MGNKNYVLTNGISMNDIPIEKNELVKEIYKNIEILNFTYICQFCYKIPKIDITYYSNGNVEKIIFKECGNSIKLLNKDKIQINQKDKIDIDFDYSFCKKVSLHKLNKVSEEYESNNISKNFLSFENLDDLYTYLDVFKSYLKIREEIKDYILDTKRNNLFSFFENLLFIGFYGYGSRYEYENAIAIKNFSFDKFDMFNAVELLKYNKRLIKVKKVKAYSIFHLRNKLYLIVSNYKTHSLIINFDTIFNDFPIFDFDFDKINRYFNKDVDRIPLKFRKNFINIIPKTYIVNERFDHNSAIFLGENKYLINDENNKLQICIYKEKENKYNISMVNNNYIVVDMHLFQKNKILVIIQYKFCVFKFDKEKNEINLIKLYKEEYNLGICGIYIKFIDLKNGDLIFNLYSKLYHICGLTNEIKNIYKIKSSPGVEIRYIKMINEKILKINYISYRENDKEFLINIYTKKEIKKNKIKKYTINKKKIDKLLKSG